MNAPRPLVVAILFLAVCSVASAETAEYIRDEYRGEFNGREMRIVFLRPADAALAREYPAEIQVFGVVSQETVDVDLQDGAYSDGYMEYRFSRDGLIMTEPYYEYHLDRLGEPSESVTGVYEMRVNEASMEPDPEGSMLVTVAFREAGDGFEAEMLSWSSAFTFRLVAGSPSPDVSASASPDASPDAVTYVSADGGDVTVSVADGMIIVDDIEGEVVGLPFDAEYRTVRRLPPPPPEPTMLAAGLSPEEYYRQVYERDMPGPIDFDTAAKTMQAFEIDLPGQAMRVARATGYLLAWTPLELHAVDVVNGEVAATFALDELDVPIDGQTARWSADGTRFLATQNFFVVLHEPDVYLFDVASGVVEGLIDDEASRVFYSGSGPVPSLDLTPVWAGESILYQHLQRDPGGFSPDLLLMDGEWDRPRPIARTPHTGPSVVDVLVSPIDGLVYYTSLGRRPSDGESGVWQVTPGRRPERIVEPIGDEGFPIAAEVSLSGDYLLLHHQVNTEPYAAPGYTVFHIESGEERSIIDPEGPYREHTVVNATLSPDGNYVAAVVREGASGPSLVLVQEVETGIGGVIFESESVPLGLGRAWAYSHIGMGWTSNDRIVIGADSGDRALVLSFQR